ncbi:MAG: hypothetical protein ACI9TH_000905 [Kiritimatiellia bacterium]|jgi:hypothetical protein
MTPARSLRKKTLLVLVLPYLAITAFLLLIEQENPVDGIGKLEVHEAYASAGRSARLGLIDRGIDRWMNAAMAYEGSAYDGFILRSVLMLSPVFMVWMLAAAAAVKGCMYE